MLVSGRNVWPAASRQVIQLGFNWEQVWEGCITLIGEGGFFKWKGQSRMEKLCGTIALKLGLYAFVNLLRNEAILNNFLSETNSQKLVPFLFSLGKMQDWNRKYLDWGNHLPRVESGYSSKLRKRDLCRTIKDGKRDKVRDKRGPVTASKGRIKWWHLQWQMRL